jgi:zinc protease
MQNKILRFILSILALTSAGFIKAQPIPLDTAVHTGVLPNGFTYYIRYNNEPKNRVFLYLVTKVGSILEDDDQQGLAHFMEHMSFNGTVHYPKNELVSYLQKSGVRFGADLNAYTSFDETVYQLLIPSDDSSILKNGFQILRDWAQDASLDSIEINKERGVVLEEERLGKGAGERMQRQFLPVIFNQSRYAQRIPIGKTDILKNFPPSVIRRFHADWYRPDLQALVVVGDLNIAEAENWVRKMFSSLKAPAQERTRTKYTVPLSGGNQFVSVTDKEMPVTVIQVFIKHAEEKLITEQDYINSMKRTMFNEIMGERLATQAQTPGLPYVQAQASISSFLGGLDAFSADIVLKQGKFKEGFQMVWELIEKVKRFGFTEPELERARKNYLISLQSAYNERGKTSSQNYVGEYQRHFLESEASPGIAWEYQFASNHINQITLEQVNEIVKEYVRDNDRDVIVLAPEKDKQQLPDSATVALWMNEVNKSELKADAEEKGGQVLLAVKPVAKKPVSVKTIKPLGITELKFPNGIRVILKPTDFKNDEIRFAAFSPGGTSVYSNARYENASHADLVAGYGAGQFSPVELNKILSGRILTVNPYISDRSEGMDGYATPKDLETAFQLIYLRFTQPRMDTAMFNNDISTEKEYIENRYSDPETVFSDTVTMVLGNYNYRKMPITAQKLAEVKPDQVYKIYSERFADASGFTFVFVGSFKTDSIMPLIETYLASLPSLHLNEQARDLGIHIPAGKMTKKVVKGSEDKATVRMVFSGDYLYNGENNLALNALKEILSIRVIQQLREEASEVYAPSVQVTYNKYPKNRYAFTVSFGCAPANASHLMDLVMKEIETLRTKGPTADDLAKFKAEYRRTKELQQTENGYWLGFLTTLYTNHEDPNQFADYLKGLDKVTTASVKKAAQNWLSGKNLIRFELLPEPK